MHRFLSNKNKSMSIRLIRENQCSIISLLLAIKTNPFNPRKSVFYYLSALSNKKVFIIKNHTLSTLFSSPAADRCALFMHRFLSNKNKSASIRLIRENQCSIISLLFAIKSSLSFKIILFQLLSVCALYPLSVYKQ